MFTVFKPSREAQSLSHENQSNVRRAAFLLSQSLHLLTKVANNKYIPGVCNIGKDEIRLRRNNMILMAAISIVLIAGLLVFDVHKLWRLSLLPFATNFAVGYQQIRNKFCVFFGMKGLFNFGDAGPRFTVEQEEMRKLDQAKARRMILNAVIFGVIITYISYLLP